MEHFLRKWNQNNMLCIWRPVLDNLHLLTLHPKRDSQYLEHINHVNGSIVSNIHIESSILAHLKTINLIFSFKATVMLYQIQESTWWWGYLGRVVLQSPVGKTKARLVAQEMQLMNNCRGLLQPIFVALSCFSLFGSELCIWIYISTTIWYLKVNEIQWLQCQKNSFSNTFAS